MRSSGRLLVGALALALLAMAGCKTGKAGTLPVNNPTTQWEQPDADDLVPEEDADAEADAEAEE